MFRMVNFKECDVQRMDRYSHIFATKMKPLNKTNKQIEEMGGVFLKGWSEYSQMFGKYITSYIYLLNGEEVYSIIDWD